MMLKAYISAMLYLVVTIAIGLVCAFKPEWPVRWQGRLERKLGLELPGSRFTPIAYNIGGVLLLLQAMFVAVKVATILRY